MSIKTTNEITRKTAEEMAYSHILQILGNQIKNDIQNMSNEDIEALLEKEFDRFSIINCPEKSELELKKNIIPKDLEDIFYRN